MSPQAILFNIAVLVGTIGIVVYWVRRFTVFHGCQEIEGAVQQIASALKAQPSRENDDVLLCGHYRGRPTIIRFSKRMDTPGLQIEMRAPSICELSLMPRIVTSGRGRVVVRTGSVGLDKKFFARTDHPGETRLLLANREMLAGLEQLCCSTQTAFSIQNKAMELSELVIPQSTVNHVMGHLDAMAAIADWAQEMPGTDVIKIEPLPRAGSSWTIRGALAGGLVCLIVLLFVQPYNRKAVNAGMNASPIGSGVLAADAVRIQRLAGWHVAGSDDFSPMALRFLRDHGLPESGRVSANFAGVETARDSAYLLVDSAGQRRVVLLAGGHVAYDGIFPCADLLLPVPRSDLAAIQWKSAPPLVADGDGLLVIENADDPTASLVLLTHKGKIYSARPADFNKIELVAQ